MIYGIILLIVLIVVILILALLVGFKVFTSQSRLSADEQDLLNTISLEQGFCDPVTGNCNGVPVAGSRGQCNVYETFTLDTATVDQLNPLLLSSLPQFLQCSDGFNMALQKNQRVCLASQCVGKNGKIFSQGGVEEFYMSCANLTACADKRTAIMLNFNVSQATQKITPDTLCITANLNAATANAVQVVPCNTLTTPQNSAFWNVLLNPISKTSGFVSIRFPISDSCLAPANLSSTAPGTVNNVQSIGSATVNLQSCNALPVAGQVFLLTPQLCSIHTQTVFGPGGVPTDQVVPPVVCYPPQLLERPSDADLTEISTIAKDTTIGPFVQQIEIIKILSKYRSLQKAATGTSLELLPYGSCSNFSQSTQPVLPPSSACAPKTALIQALSWNQITNNLNI